LYLYTVRVPQAPGIVWALGWIPGVAIAVEVLRSRRLGSVQERWIALFGGISACAVAGVLDASRTGVDLNRFTVDLARPGLIEEATCGCVLLVIFTARQRTIDPWQWIGHAVLIGAGFGAMEQAFTLEGSYGIWPNGIVRCAMHVMFVTMTAAGISAASRTRSIAARVALVAMGLGLAITTHAAWDWGTARSGRHPIVTLIVLVTIAVWLTAVATIVRRSSNARSTQPLRSGCRTSSGSFAPAASIRRGRTAVDAVRVGGEVTRRPGLCRFVAGL
jgi:hypothetical protein